MTDDKTKDAEILIFLDTLPNLIRMGLTEKVEDVLRERFEVSLPDKIARYGKLQYLMIRLGPFNMLIREVRSLFIDGYYRAAVALCGMTIEALCIAIAEERVKDKSLKKQLVDPSIVHRKKEVPREEYHELIQRLNILMLYVEKEKARRNNLFVYGSLMDKGVVAQRLGMSLREVNSRFTFDIARLPQWKRVFDVSSERWQGGALNLRRDKRFTKGILGVLIRRLELPHLDLLDKAEGRRYRRVKVNPLVENEEIVAWTYISKESDKNVQPSKRYIDFLCDSLFSLDEHLYRDFVRRTYDASGRRLYLDSRNN